MSTEIEGLRLKSSRLFRCLFAVVLDTLMDRTRCMATEIGLVLGLGLEPMKTLLLLLLSKYTRPSSNVTRFFYDSIESGFSGTQYRSSFKKRK
jgi:hypothetical protein